MITTTLNAIRAQHPCEDGWKRLLRHLDKTKADDEPLPLTTVLDSNGIDDALWCLRAVEGFDKEKRLFAVWCARQVQHLLTDPRSIAALDVAERFANGLASQEELEAAYYAAYSAAYCAIRAARAAAYAAWQSASAAYSAAYCAARAAAAHCATDAVAHCATRAASAVDGAAVYVACEVEKFKEIFG